ncbi:NAD(P)-binding protein, partial [Methylopila henanensis]
MSGFHRLPATAPARFGTEIDRSEPVGGRYDGRPLVGLYGDTLASALLASGSVVFGRSALLGRPRGLFALGADDPHAWACAEADADPGPADFLGLTEGFVARPPADDASPLARLFERRGSAAAGASGRLPPLGRRLAARLARHLPLPAVDRPFDAVATPATRESCDVLVIGAGLAGLAAASAAAAAGLRVVMVEAAPRVGGAADLYDETVDGRPPLAWARDRAAGLVDRGAEIALRAVAVAVDANGAVTALDRGPGPRPGPLRLRLIEPRALVIATGWRERGLLFAGNDRPGVILAGAARALLRRYAVAPGARVVIATASDEGHRTAIDLREAGVTVEMTVDARENPDTPMVNLAKALGAPMSFASVVDGVETSSGGDRVVSVTARNRFGEGIAAAPRRLFADALVVSGGLAPRDDLWGGAGDAIIVTDGPDMADAVAGGHAAGAEAARRLGAVVDCPAPEASGAADAPDDAAARAAYRERLTPEGARTAFVDLGADVTAADVAEAIARGVGG